MQKEELRKSKGVQNTALIWRTVQGFPVWSVDLKNTASRDGIMVRAGKTAQRLEIWRGGDGRVRDSLEG